MNKQKELWDKGIPAEVSFWDEWLETKGSLWPDEFIFRINPDSTFQDYLIKYLPLDKQFINILDVGTGPLSFLGKNVNINSEVKRELRITGTDPLADEYLVLLKKHNLSCPIFSVKANSEELSKHFPENYFDFVYMRNALDHSFDPLTAIGEMIKVVEKGRFIVLEHENNEAENENYKNLHQWNIAIENGSFIIWNKSTRFNVTEHYKNEVTFNCFDHGDYNLIEIIKKR